LEPVPAPVDLGLPEPGQVEHRLAQRLGRDRAGLDAHPADHVAPLDQGDPAAELRPGDGSLLAAGAGSQDKQVIVVHRTVPPCSADARRGWLHPRGRSLSTVTPPIVPGERPYRY